MTGADTTGHGGDLDAATREFGAPAAGWLDLSTGINPIGYPVDAASAALWQRLPGRGLEDRVVAAARERYRVPVAARVVAAPGTQAILQWLPQLLTARRVAVVSPTYSEHARTWSAAAEVREPAGLDAALADGDVDTVVLCNPNNPDGRTEDPGRLAAAAGDLAARGGRLIVDEAFCDTRPDLSVVGHAGDGGDGLVVLRSLGKMYGLAGARVGFAIGESNTLDGLARSLGPWAVAGPSLAVALAALSDSPWLDEARTRLAQGRERLDRLLNVTGLTLLGGTDLFRLIETPMADTLFSHLARDGIWVRRFTERPEWLRFGLPGPDADWRRLETSLAAWTETVGDDRGQRT